MKGRELVIGVTGGVSAYKTAALVSQLVQAGAGVSVVMTHAALEFIGPSTFEALTGRPVHRQVFHEAGHPLGAHIDLAERAELLCVAPATANFLAKAACGMADDLLSTLVLSFSRTLVVAPAMNCEMWAKASVQRNVEQLRAEGHETVVFT
ncbi:MAG: flavoprotein, partial [Pirellulales bacterium]